MAGSWGVGEARTEAQNRNPERTGSRKEQRLPDRGQKPETGGRKPEDRSHKPEAKGQRAEL